MNNYRKTNYYIYFAMQLNEKIDVTFPKKLRLLGENINYGSLFSSASMSVGVSRRI